MYMLMHVLFQKQLKLSRPNADELGYADSVSVEEIGGARVCFMPLFLSNRHDFILLTTFNSL